MKKARERDDSHIYGYLLLPLPPPAGPFGATAWATPVSSFYGCRQFLRLPPAGVGNTGFRFCHLPRFLFTCFALFQAFKAVLANLYLPMKNRRMNPAAKSNNSLPVLWPLPSPP
jgi:anti-sigma B factor antagonist